MTNSLQQEIDALKEQYAADVQALNDNLVAAESRRDALRKEIAELRSELAQVDTEYMRIQGDLETLPERYRQHSIGDLVVEALTQSRDELFGRLDDFRQIEEQRVKIGNDIPDLEQALDEFQEFEKTKDHLAALPDSYRHSLLTHHEALKQKVKPHFDLLELEEVIADKPLKVLLLLVFDPQESQVNWVLPVPYAAETYPPEIAPLVDEFAEMCIYGILRLGQHPDWYFAGMDEEATSWQGFSSLATLMEYSGEEPPAVHAAEILQQQFDSLLSGGQSGPLKGLNVTIEAAEIPQDAWEWAGAPEYSAVVEPELKPKEPLPPLFERSQGWYADADITAWERSLNVTEESAWNVQGRRLRTALISLLSRGYVDVNFVDNQILWQALPSPHKEAMRQGIDRLLERDILLKGDGSNGAGKTLVTINSAMIDDVQDLINRQVGDLWQAIVNA